MIYHKDDKSLNIISFFMLVRSIYNIYMQEAYMHMMHITVLTSFFNN